MRIRERPFVILEPAAVKIIGPAFGNVVHHRARSAPILHAEVVRNHRNFFQGVLISQENGGAGDRIVIVGLAVNLEVVGSAAQSIRGNTSAVGVAEIVVAGVGNPGDIQRQRVKTPAQG